MKAIVLTKTGPIESKPLTLVELPIPKPKEREILIKVSVCGACHTDLDEAEGRLPTKLPVVPGHQVVGMVSELGKGVSKHKVGDRVGVTWLYSSCGQCDFCKKGEENLCEKAKWTGKDANGGYAEYMVINENYAYPIPKRFTDSQAAPLLCAGVIGYRTLRLADIQKGETIGLYGFGASAHIVIQIIKHKFPDNPVFTFSKTGGHAELAKSLGAAWTGLSGDIPPVKLDKIMDFTPVGECVRDALKILNRGGRLVINAIRKETPIPALDYAEYLWLEKEIKSVANVTRRDAEEFLPLAAQIPIVPTIEEFPLEQANEVLLRIKQSKLKAAGVLKIGNMIK
ncbi:MAG: zinc-dependent alcohol dehydrogenase family protein [Sedimentisphaerales bacterium]